MENIIVTSCNSCPFANSDRDVCNLAWHYNEFENEYWDLPEDKVNDRCPLLKNSINISLNKADDVNGK